MSVKINDILYNLHFIDRTKTEATFLKVTNVFHNGLITTVLLNNLYEKMYNQTYQIKPGDENFTKSVILSKDLFSNQFENRFKPYTENSTCITTQYI